MFIGLNSLISDVLYFHHFAFDFLWTTKSKEIFR